MVYLSEEEVYEAYEASSAEADEWRSEYSEYERLANNGLLEDLDENLPEVNDGSLAASLFKLAKRVIKKKMAGRATALDRDDDWLTELANIYWEKKILPNAKSKASPRRKWKDAVRKAAIFGGQPIITLFVQRGSYRGADFIVPYAQDVKLEAGKDSDEDSDILFWDVYYSKNQIENMIEQAEEEMAEAKVEKAEFNARKKEYKMMAAEHAAMMAEDPTIPPMPEFDEEEPEAYNTWHVDVLKDKIKTAPGDSRPGQQAPEAEANEGKKKTGYHFFIAFQRGENAPFMMCDPDKSISKDGCVREWSNPDPTGDVPIHYLYCYQDFINPYGIGIVKLAGGTQNVLDYMRQADILATQVGIRPPKLIQGDEDEVDEESMVMAQDANWYVGNANVTPWNMATGVYQQLPARISMYQTSLQKMIPMGDTSIPASDSGDPNVGRTPQALKMANESLSIDDEDFAENVDECYELVAASMINTQFANMQGSDILKLSEDERDLLKKAGIPFNIDEATGEVPRDLEVIWDESRGTFQFVVDADADKTTDDKMRLEGLTVITELLKDPLTQQFLATGQPIMLGTKKLDPGELVGEIISLSTDNDKIMTDVTPEDQKAAAAASVAAQVPLDENGQPIMDPNAVVEDPNAPVEGDVVEDEPLMELPEGEEFNDPNALTAEEEEAGAKIQEVVEVYGVTPEVAATMLEAEDQGAEPEDILAAMERAGLVPEGTVERMMASQGAMEGELVNA